MPRSINAEHVSHPVSDCQSDLAQREIFRMGSTIGIGFAALIIGLVLLPFRDEAPSSLWVWALPFRTMQAGPHHFSDTVLPMLVECVGGVVFGVLACWDLARRRELR
jgi:hypothetical protein